jgi:acetyltransferase-like isoleucine patch superfamily enzyme
MLRRAPWELRYKYGAKVASEFRRLMVLATHRHCHVEFQGPVYLGPGFSLDIPDNGTLIVGAGTEFRRGFRCEIGGGGRVLIGGMCHFTYDPIIACSTLIEIGSGCGVGQNVYIVDGVHRFRDWSKDFYESGYEFREIHIGDHVQIHSKCTIQNSIGHHAVIGANSVVTREIPPWCLAVGAPARVIEYIGPPEERPPDLDV